ncbi:MAG: class I SAM-dependent methyltransferase [Rubripirellula sp.]
MLTVQSKRGHYYFSVLWHPVSRVLKFQRFVEFFESLPEGGVVLDYGAGDRPYEQMMLTKFDQYVAADYPDANAAHGARPDIAIVDNSLEMESESVDCVILTEVMEHLYEPRLALEEMFRVLKPGGRIIGTVPFAMNEHEQPYDFHRYTSFCLKQMFADAGFECVKLDYIGDTLGVATMTFSRVFGITNKALNKLGLKPLAMLVQLVYRIPELLYYLMLKCGLNPQRIDYYGCYPFGFAFHIQKPGSK